jgi:hypothetical protein
MEARQRPRDLTVKRMSPNGERLVRRASAQSRTDLERPALGIRSHRRAAKVSVEMRGRLRNQAPAMNLAVAIPIVLTAGGLAALALALLRRKLSGPLLADSGRVGR